MVIQPQKFKSLSAWRTEWKEKDQTAPTVEAPSVPASVPVEGTASREECPSLVSKIPTPEPLKSLFSATPVKILKSPPTLVGHQNAYSQLLSWLRTSSGVAALIGATGVGKTTLVKAVAKFLKRELLIFEISHSRSKETITSFVAEAARSLSLTGAKRILLIEDVETVEAGLLSCLSGRVTIPVILTSPSAVKGVTFSLVVRLYPLSYDESKILYQSVSKKKAKAQDVIEAVEKANGDNRQLILLAREAANTPLTQKDSSQSPWDICKRLFNGQLPPPMLYDELTIGLIHENGCDFLRTLPSSSDLLDILVSLDTCPWNDEQSREVYMEALRLCVARGLPQTFFSGQRTTKTFLRSSSQFTYRRAKANQRRELEIFRTTHDLRHWSLSEIAKNFTFLKERLSSIPCSTQSGTKKRRKTGSTE